MKHTPIQHRKPPYSEWRRIVKKYYKCAGWPTAEMRQYYDKGYSPKRALNAAHQKRIELLPQDWTPYID